ncbi:hypothetical protein OC25_02215 [Pedobacter kyungheensis]|uniref:Uncharacterized protein n=1 Tax=Pedobacter kyungheensis TaxID=1069985 RepID=A0A0C1DR93_9SPHI|nr:hypothetical protein [Pedobacter kyungheensis]KIA96575.1 hypothetical protein OC25_02215 [Pedobacter kyungheensis]
MGKITNLISGLAGAVVLNILHESLKSKGSGMPHIDRLGEQALQKSLRYLGTGIEDEHNRYLATLAGDVAGNAVYYSLIGGRNSLIWPKAIALGLAAGIGAVTLPRPMGLDPKPVARNAQATTLTIAYYLTGALATASVLKLFKNRL